MKTPSIALTFLVLFSAASVQAEPSSRALHELTNLAAATSLACDASHRFAQELVVCEGKRCTRLDVTGKTHTVFEASAKADVRLTSSVATTSNGTLLADSETTRIEAGSSRTVSQTVVGKGRCMKNVLFQLRSL